MHRRAVWFGAVLALAACKGTEPFVPVPTAVVVSPDTANLTAIGATRRSAPRCRTNVAMIAARR
jgi:hypothetical protein